MKSCSRGQAAASFLVILLLALAPADARPAGWCKPVPLTPLNTSDNDNGPELSSNGHALFFGSNGRGGEGKGDLYVARRAIPQGEWGVPVNLDGVDPTGGVNTSDVENAPALARGGHVLYFSSDRDGGIGPVGGPGCDPAATPLLHSSSCDIWVSERVHTREDRAWTETKNVGAPINSEYVEFMGDVFENEATGVTELYFTSSRKRDPDDTPGDHDVYVSRIAPDGRFGAPELVEEVSTDAREERVGIAADGLSMFFQSNRPGGSGPSDLWVSTRKSTGDPWRPPENLGPPINTPAFEGGPRLSSDGKTLYFFSNRPGGSGGVDLYTSMREPEHGCPP